MKRWVYLALMGYASLSFADGLPFREAVKAGNTLYVSGQVGYVMQNGKPVVVDGGIKDETHQAMKNPKQVVENNGFSMDDLVKCTVMMTDLRHWEEMDKAYASYFSEGLFPARSVLGTTGLALSANVEIECIATKNHK